MLTPFRKKRSSRQKNARRILEERNVSLPDADLSFLFQRDGCRTLRMTVRADGSVRVKAPASIPWENVLAFVRSRLDWVREKRAFFADHRGVPAPAREGSAALYLGRAFTLRPVPARRNARAHFRGNTLELPCLRPGLDDEARNRAVERAFLRWRLDAASLILNRRLSRLDQHAREKLGDSASAHSLTVRSLKRRWGSCSVRGDITLAAQLVEMPLPLIDYVICHELCHLRAMNHGPAFHALLRTLLPDAGEREKRIRIWGLEHPRT